MFIRVVCFWMCILFYLSFVCLHVCAHAFKFKVHCGSAFEPGASGLPYYWCVPDVIGALAVWWQKNKKKMVCSIPVVIQSPQSDSPMCHSYAIIWLVPKSNSYKVVNAWHISFRRRLNVDWQCRCLAWKANLTWWHAQRGVHLRSSVPQYNTYPGTRNVKYTLSCTRPSKIVTNGVRVPHLRT